MKLQYLDENWSIVIIVTVDTLAHFDQTLVAVSQKSVSQKVSVLASDDAKVHRHLSSCDFPVVFSLPAVLLPDRFWITILANVSADGAVLFLQSGTDVPEHWDARLAASGQRAGGAALVSPLSVRDPVLGIYTQHTHSPGQDVDAIDQWLNDYSSGSEFPVPSLSHCCLYVPANFLSACGNCFDSEQIADEAQLLQRIRFLDAGPLATDQLYVDDQNLEYRSPDHVLPPAWQEAFLQRSRLTAIRHAISELSSRGEAPPNIFPCLPVQLHVGHSWGGGLSRWMEDYIHANSSHRQLVLRSVGELTAFGQVISLYASASSQQPLRSWTLSEPILSVSQGNAEYRQLIADLVAQFSVESVVVSSLIGHSLDILRTALPTTLVLHEFFPFCPALYATFESPCQSCDAARLDVCMRENPGNSFFKFESSGHWLNVRAKFLEIVEREPLTVVAPSFSVVDRYRQLAPSLDSREIHIIPHGLATDFSESLAKVREGYCADFKSRLKVVMLGRLTNEKGGDILAEMLPTLGESVDVWLLGTGESGVRYAGMRNVEVIPSYSSLDLADLLLEIQPDLGLILSTVPETFSYTLSELHTAGIPVLATRLGALAERIVEDKSGWLVAPNGDAVVAKIARLDRARAEIESARSYLAMHAAPTAADMVESYARVLPEHQQIPLIRYHLPRRSFRSPYSQTRSESASASGAMTFSAAHSYRQVLIEFLGYSARKAEYSPKLHPRVAAVISRSLRTAARWIGRPG